MIQLDALIFGVFIVVLLDIIALVTSAFGYSLIGSLLSLVFTAYTISDKDGLVIIQSDYNTATNQFVYSTSPVYPFWALSLAILTIFSLILTIVLIERK